MSFIVDDIILFFIIFIGVLFIFSKKDYKILLPLLSLQTFINIAYFAVNITKESDFIVVSSFSLFLPILVVFIFCFYEKLNLSSINSESKVAKIVKYYIVFVSFLFLILTTIYILNNYNIITIDLPLFLKSNTSNKIVVTQSNNNLLLVNRNYVLAIYIIMVFILNSFKNTGEKYEE